MEDLRQSLASVTQAKIGFEKLCRNQEDQLHEASEKNAELSREMADMNAANARLGLQKHPNFDRPQRGSSMNLSLKFECSSLIFGALN